jgi:hypothetical protein
LPHIDDVHHSILGFVAAGLRPKIGADFHPVLREMRAVFAGY